MKKLFKVLFMFLFVLFASVGCSAAGDSKFDGSQNQYQDAETAGDDYAGNNVVVETNRKIIYTASYTITSDKIGEIKNSINQKTIELQGYISSSNENKNSATVVYNIPTDQFNLFLDYVDSFEGIGSKNISSKDVTATYSEIEARISILQASRSAYLSILESGNLTKNEIMQIQDKINSIDTELLSISLQKDSYDNQMEYSKVTINYYTSYSVPKEKTYFQHYFDYLKNFFTGLGSFVLYTLPVFTLLGGIFSAIFFPIVASVKKRNRK